MKKEKPKSKMVGGFTVHWKEKAKTGSAYFYRDKFTVRIDYLPDGKIKIGKHPINSKYQKKLLTFITKFKKEISKWK